MDDNCNMFGINNRRCAAIEGRIVKPPLRRSLLPDKLRKIVPVFVVADPTAVGGQNNTDTTIEARSAFGGTEPVLPAAWLLIR